MDDKQSLKYQQMTETPVGPLILRLAVPCMISMMVTAFYNMADTFFVGMLKSNAATGAVGVVFSLMAIIQAIGFFFGQGSGTFISRALGKQDRDAAETMSAVGFFTALCAGVVLCIIGHIFLEPLAYLLGSTGTILPHAKAYLSVILFGAPWMMASLVLNNQLRFQGSAAYAMAGIASGAILNVGLDPLFIFVFRLGVAGAAWATIISQFVSFCVLLLGCSRGGNLMPRISKLNLDKRFYTNIVKGGLPSLARQGFASIATICLNHAARPYGDVVIAAMSVVQRIMMCGASAMIGFGQGFQPVCGFNYGAKLYGRVRQGFDFCVKSCFVFLCAVAAVIAFFAPQLVAVFRDDPEVIACGTAALRYQCITFPTLCWVIPSNMMEQTIGRTVPATFLAVARQGLFFIPLVWVFSAVWGVHGIQMTQMFCDLLTFACAIPIQLHVLRTLENPLYAKH